MARTVAAVCQENGGLRLMLTFDMTKHIKNCGAGYRVRDGHQRASHLGMLAAVAAISSQAAAIWWRSPVW